MRDMETLLSFYQNGRKKGTFDAGIENALRLILTNPKFLFRTEPDPANVGPGSHAIRLGDLELASRLSFFLWSSIPDDELLGLAARKAQGSGGAGPAGAAHARRSDRSNALVEQFRRPVAVPAQSAERACRTARRFPNFDDNLRQAFRQETEMFFESIMRENRSVLDLLNANYTFVNERLAKHYGIPMSMAASSAA